MFTAHVHDVRMTLTHAQACCNWPHHLVMLWMARAILSVQVCSHAMCTQPNEQYTVCVAVLDGRSCSCCCCCAKPSLLAELPVPPNDM
jgi:hypothetical protein